MIRRRSKSFPRDLASLRDGSLGFGEFARRNTNTFRRWAGYFFNRWPQSALDVEDLAQEALIAAWRAVDSWDPSRGCALTRHVEVSVGRHLRQCLRRVLGWPDKRRGHVPVRHVPLEVEIVDYRDVPGDAIDANRAFSAWMMQESDPFRRDVVDAVRAGMPSRAVAAHIYSDPERRRVYQLASLSHALRGVRRVVKEVVSTRVDTEEPGRRALVGG